MGKLTLEDCFEDEDEEIVTPYIHIFGQSAHHENVNVFGNHEALIKLHRALTDAITKGEWTSDNVFCWDWEWYHIYVKDMGTCWLGNLDLPYKG